MTIAKPEPLMSVQDLAHWLNVKPSWVQHNYRTAGLPTLSIGRQLRFRRQDVERWLAAQERGADARLSAGAST